MNMCVCVCVCVRERERENDDKILRVVLLSVGVGTTGEWDVIWQKSKNEKWKKQFFKVVKILRLIPDQKNDIDSKNIFLFRPWFCVQKIK